MALKLGHHLSLDRFMIRQIHGEELTKITKDSISRDNITWIPVTGSNSEEGFSHHALFIVPIEQLVDHSVEMLLKMMASYLIRGIRWNGDTVTGRYLEVSTNIYWGNSLKIKPAEIKQKDILT